MGSRRRLLPGEIRSKLGSGALEVASPDECCGQVALLGRLAALNAKYNSRKAPIGRARLAVFCGTHGIATRGVSALPGDFVRTEFAKFQDGASVGAIVASSLDIERTIVDAGIDSPTHDFSQSMAMDGTELDRSLLLGWRTIGGFSENVVAFGEIGVGNTTSASALAALVLNVDVGRLVGRGSGITKSAMVQKIAIVTEAVNRHLDHRGLPLEALSCVGGREIASLVGGMLRASVDGKIIVLDGFVTAVAALVASRIYPATIKSFVGMCRSSERGHPLVCRELGLSPFIDIRHSSGQGVGACISFAMLRLTGDVLSASP